MADAQYRKTPRASFLDYDTGEYFVTICTKGINIRPATTTIKYAAPGMPKILQVIFYAMWSAGMKTNIVLDYHPNFA